MGNYTIFICLLLQGVPYFYAHECTIAPVSVTENLFLGTTTGHSEIFTPVQTTIKLWRNISTLLPKSHAGPSVVWNTPNIALILGQKNLLKLEHIHTGLGLDKPMLLNAFAVHNGIISTFYIGNQQGCTKYFLSGIQSFSRRICLMKRGIIIIKKCDKKADIKWFCTSYLLQLCPRLFILYLKW